VNTFDNFPVYPLDALPFIACSRAKVAREMAKHISGIPVKERVAMPDQALAFRDQGYDSDDSGLESIM